MPENNRLNRERRASGATDRKELADIGKKIATMLDVIKDGGYARGMMNRMRELEARQDEIAEARPLNIGNCTGGTRASRFWSESMARFHYLGCNRLVGAQIRYIVHDPNGCTLSLPGYSTAVRKLATRDRAATWNPCAIWCTPIWIYNCRNCGFGISNRRASPTMGDAIAVFPCRTANCVWRSTNG